jgi:hypothetical protein
MENKNDDERLNSKPYIPYTTYGVANKLFIAFLFIDPDVGVQVLKDVGLIESNKRSSASLQPFTGQSSLSTFAVMSLRN